MPQSIAASLTLSLCLPLAALSASCESYQTVRGSGMVMVESRVVDPQFHSIEVSGSADVVLTQGAETSLTIECDDNLLPHILATVKDNVLRVRFERGSWTPSERPVYRVQLVDVHAISLSGSNRLTADQLDSEDLSLHISGSGTAQIEGVTTATADFSTSGSGEISLGRLSAEAAELHISGSGTIRVSEGSIGSVVSSISGSGDLLLPDVAISEARVRMSGSSAAEMMVEEDLDARISGSGSIGLNGQPKALATKVTGSGKVFSLGAD